MKKWNKVQVLLLAAMLALTTAACGAPSSATSPKDIAMSSAANAETAVAMEDQRVSTNADTAATPPKSNRKLIRTVNLEIETKDFDGISKTITQEIEALGGYIESSDVSGRGYNNENRRYANIVARIPQDKVNGFINIVDEAGSITNRQESVEDVTLQYVDVESRKKSLQIEQERLLALLEKAEQLEDIIALEQRLSQVRYQLEGFEAQLRTFDNQVDYSTVSMYIREVERISPVEEKTVWTRMSAGLQRSVYDIGKGLQNFAVWFVVNLPYFALWAIVVGCISVVLIKLTKRTPKPKPPQKPFTPQKQYTWPTDHSTSSPAHSTGEVQKPVENQDDRPK